MEAGIIAFGSTLLIASVVALYRRRPARIMGVALMASSWVMTMSLQIAWGYTPYAAFALMDLFVAAMFFAIGGYYDRPWATIVGVLHVLMLFTHWVYSYTIGSVGAVTEDMQLWYLRVLTVLSCASLLMIAVPPIWNWILRRRSNDHDYVPYLHPRSSRSSVRRSVHEKAAE